MQTRSMTSSQILSVNIDFDGASRAWRANKRSIGNGCYEYKISSKKTGQDNTEQKTSVRTRQQVRNSTVAAQSSKTVSTTRSGTVYKRV